jgi:hypothetical protein
MATFVKMCVEHVWDIEIGTIWSIVLLIPPIGTVIAMLFFIIFLIAVIWEEIIVAWYKEYFEK